MFGRRRDADWASAQSKLDAVDRSQAMIEFRPDGTINSANKNFLDAMGYSLAEIRGRHTAAKMRSLEDAGKIAAIDRVQARIEFNLDGTIISANDNFLTAMGYSLTDIQGKHHGMFVEPSTRESAAYREFWADLNRGVYKSAEFKRIAKRGWEV